MKIAYTLAAIAFIVLCLTGCGHNCIIVSDGLGFETTANPETFAFGLSIRYGKIITIAVKEKSQVSIETGLKQQNESGTSNVLGLDTKISVLTGDQVTGYTVELEKVKSSK